MDLAFVGNSLMHNVNIGLLNEWDAKTNVIELSTSPCHRAVK